jgi:predicted TIM-barrel fold metal-dependent hydrolase
MERMAIISVDGHVKASRAGYRDYFEEQYLDAFDEWVAAQEAAGVPDAGNLNYDFGVESQWDSDNRLAALEGVGVVAEVLFPNGVPFQASRLEDLGASRDRALDRQARMAYNRWLADFCAATPGRRAGQAVISFDDDIDAAAQDVYWAKEHGLAGVMMPPLNPGGTFFFDPVLDPVWAACQDTGLPLSQHGGTGAPAYSPPGFASIITLAMEHAFFSGRSLWQLMVGGVFDRFPELQLVFVETEAYWMGPMINRLEGFTGMGSDWMGFARSLNRDATMRRSPKEYWTENCYAGLSPFTASMVPIEDFARDDCGAQSEFFITADKAMFGVDYPHFESILPSVSLHVGELLGHPAITDEHARKVLFENAARVYGFDLDALEPHFERVGFTREDVLAAAA